MALMYTPAGEMNSLFPEFSLPGSDDKTWHSKQLLASGKPIVVMFLCNHCPYVQAIETRLIELANQFIDRAEFIAICSNDPADYPEDSFENLKARAEEMRYPFPYLYDESQSVAKAFGAVCTPDIYLYHNGGQLQYRGRLDDSWKDTSKVTKKELQLAIEMALEGQLIPPEEQNPSMGCSIKWKEL